MAHYDCRRLFLPGMWDSSISETSYGPSSVGDKCQMPRRCRFGIDFEGIHAWEQARLRNLVFTEAGKIRLMQNPTVYCLSTVDNAPNQKWSLNFRQLPADCLSVIIERCGTIIDLSKCDLASAFLNAIGQRENVRSELSVSKDRSA